MIVDLYSNGAITEEEVKVLYLMPVPRLSRNIVQEFAIPAMEPSGGQLVVRKRMMQKQALLPEFAAKEYSSKIFGKGLEEVVELSLVPCLLLIPMIVLNKKFITATTNKALTSAASISDMVMSAFFLPRVEATEAPSSMGPGNP